MEEAREQRVDELAADAGVVKVRRIVRRSIRAAEERARKGDRQSSILGQAPTKLLSSR